MGFDISQFVYDNGGLLTAVVLFSVVSYKFLTVVNSFFEYLNQRAKLDDERLKKRDDEIALRDKESWGIMQSYKVAIDALNVSINGQNAKMTQAQAGQSAYQAITADAINSILKSQKDIYSQLKALPQQVKQVVHNELKSHLVSAGHQTEEQLSGVKTDIKTVLTHLQTIIAFVDKLPPPVLLQLQSLIGILEEFLEIANPPADEPITPESEPLEAID